MDKRFRNIVLFETVSNKRFIRIIFFCSCVLFVLAHRIATAQFSGSVSLNGYKATNVEGRDSATPDNVINPSINLIYNWIVTDPTAIRLEAQVTPTFFQDSKSRSYTKSFFSATGNFYLTNIQENVSAPIPLVSIPGSHLSQDSIKHSDTKKQAVAPTVVIENRTDIGHLVSGKLTSLTD